MKKFVAYIATILTVIKYGESSGKQRYRSNKGCGKYF